LLNNMPLSYQNTKRKRLFRAITKTPGLLFYHPMNETSGTVAHNYAPGNLGLYNTNLNGGATFGNPGKIGRAAALDGTTGMFSVPNNVAFGSLANCSILVNMKLNGAGTVFQKPFYKNGVYDFGINNNGNPFVEIVGVYNQGQFSSHNTYDNISHLMGITNIAGTVATYIDGTQASLAGGTNTPTAVNTNAVAYGENYGNSSEFLMGTIQNFAFYNQGLTAGQYRKIAHAYGYI